MNRLWHLTGLALTVTWTCPGLSTIAPKMTRAPSTRSAPRSSDSVSTLPRPFCSDTTSSGRCVHAARVPATEGVACDLTLTRTRSAGSSAAARSVVVRG